MSNIATLVPMAEEAAIARERLFEEISNFVEALSIAFDLKGQRRAELPITDGWTLSRNAEKWAIFKEVGNGPMLEISSRSRSLTIMQLFMRSLTPELLDGLEFTFAEMANRSEIGSKLLHKVTEKLIGATTVIQRDSAGNVVLLVRVPKGQQTAILPVIAKTHEHVCKKEIGPNGIDLKIIFPTK